MKVNPLAIRLGVLWPSGLIENPLTNSLIPMTIKETRPTSSKRGNIMIMTIKNAPILLILDCLGKYSTFYIIMLFY